MLDSFKTNRWNAYTSKQNLYHLPNLRVDTCLHDPYIQVELYDPYIHGELETPENLFRHMPSRGIRINFFQTMFLSQKGEIIKKLYF